MVVVFAVFAGILLLFQGPAPVAAALGAGVGYLSHDSIEAWLARARP